MRRSKRFVWLVAMVLVLGLLAAACGGDDDSSTSSGSGSSETTAANGAGGGGLDTDNPVVIGAVMPQTGDFGVVGSEATIGMKAAVDELNSNGGILGRKVELVVRDSASDPNRGILAVRQILDDAKPVFMLPDTISSIAKGTQPITTQARIPTSSAASAPDLGDAKTFPYHFQAFVQSDKQGLAVYSGLKQKGAKKVGILSSNDAAGVAFSTSAEQVLPKLGFDVVGKELFQPGSSDLTVQAQKLKSAGADGLAVHAIGPDNGAIMKAVNDLAWDAVVVADASSLTGDLTKIIPAAAADKFFTIGARTIIQGPDTKALFDRFSKFGNITSLQVPAINHDIVMFAAWAMEKAKSTDADKIKAALETLDAASDSDLPKGLVYFPNPKWSPTVHSLANADLSQFWALIATSAPTNGAYKGEPLTLLKGSGL